MIDQGGHATRTIVFDSLGHIVCHAETPIKTITRKELEVEHDPVELLDSVFSAIDQVQEIMGDDYCRIEKAGLATQRSSIVCWDNKTGKVLSPIISWQDRRTSRNISQYEKSAEMIHDVTGLYLNPHYGATKMRWCLDNLPEVKKALDSGTLCVAPMASFILYHLLDEKPLLIDPANASRSLLMNYKTLNWEPELLNLFSIPEEILPEISLTKNMYGNISRHKHNIPLMICTGDQSAVIYSEGKLADNEVFVNAGTGAFILKTSEGVPDLQKEKLLASVVYAEKHHISYVIEGTVNGAGRALQWFAEQSSIINYEARLDEWCNEFTAPPIFINAISGIGSPYWIAEYDSHFVFEVKVSEAKNTNHEDFHSAVHEAGNEVGSEEKFVAVLESIVFLITENIKCIQNISEQVTQIRLAGGITASKGFCQKLSNLLKCSVVLAPEKEATAKGVFYLLSGQVPEKTASYSATFHPKNDPMLLNRNTHWRKLMKEQFLI